MYLFHNAKLQLFYDISKFFGEKLSKTQKYFCFLLAAQVFLANFALGRLRCPFRDVGLLMCIQPINSLDMLRVKEILKSKGITQKELASRLGINESTLSLNLKEDANPSLRILQGFATALGVPIGELFEAPQEVKETRQIKKLVCPHCGKPIHIRVEVIKGMESDK